MPVEALIAGIAGVLAAAIAAGPLYIGLRRGQGAVTSAVNEGVNRLEGRLDAVRTELLTDIADVRAWQVSHTAEHILITTDRRNNDE